MIEIEKYSCTNKNEALKRERFWFEQLSASLNKVIPNNTYETKPVEMFIKKYVINTENKDDYVTLKELKELYISDGAFKLFDNKDLRNRLIKKIGSFKEKTKIKVNNNWIDFRSVFIGWKLK